MMENQMNPDSHCLTDILDRAIGGRRLDRHEIRYLLSISNQADINSIKAAARKVRQDHFGNKVFLYGFLYFSTHCRNNCTFCNFRRSNHSLKRYRKTETQIKASARELAGSGVHLIDLTMGEDPDITCSELGLRRLVKLTSTVKQLSGLPVMMSPGVLSKSSIKELAEAGADWYACYQETHTRGLYQRLRQNQSYDERMETKRVASSNGMLIEEGILTGVGETLDDLANSIVKMRSLDADQVRVMTFVPQANTPLAHLPAGNSRMEQLIISVLRLVFPDRLIPASLDVDGLDGLKDRLDAGANVVTSIVPPGSGLSGVANASLDIDESRRSVSEIVPVLEECSLRPATNTEYKTWIELRKQTKDSSCQAGRKAC